MHTVLRLLGSATPVLWVEELRAAAVSGADTFIGHTFRPETLNPNPQLWVFDVDVVFTEDALKDMPDDPLDGKPPAGYSIDGLLIGTFDDHVLALEICRASVFELELEDQKLLALGLAGRIQVPDRLAPFIRPVILDTARTETRAVAGMVAMLEFMNLELAAVQPLRLSRPERRRRKRRGITEEPDIRVVTLRRKHHEKKNVQEDVDWSCRWIVSGHWRKQWYPSKDEHRPIFISPYVKGPEDKPFKTSGQKILKVAR